jgi:translocation and assembly module TamB
MAMLLSNQLLAQLWPEDAGEDVTEEGKPTYNIEFRLNERWSVVGEYDRFGELNGGLKLRVYSR